MTQKKSRKKLLKNKQQKSYHIWLRKNLYMNNSSIGIFFNSSYSTIIVLLYLYGFLLVSPISFYAHTSYYYFYVYFFHVFPHHFIDLFLYYEFYKNLFHVLQHHFMFLCLTFEVLISL